MKEEFTSFIIFSLIIDLLFHLTCISIFCF